MTPSPGGSSPARTVVVGAGVVGAACAYYLSRAGIPVTLVDRGAVAGGTTGGGEGNVLVSDKEPGPELQLALLSARLWRELGDEHGTAFEYDPKGGLVVGRDASAMDGLRALLAGQREAGVDGELVAADELPSLEPHLARDLAGGVVYPQDAQVQPMLAAAHLVRTARARGAVVHTRCEVTGVLRDGDTVTGVRTSRGDIPAAAVVNAAGTWGGEVAAMAGVELPILPRRGFVLVTEPLPPRTVRRKVYAAEYVANVASDAAGLETSPVVEGTQAGTILVGSSRERVGFDRTFSQPVLLRIAAQAVELFPVLSGVTVLRAYQGFRPYCPDHLPVIGPDSRAPGLFHACGHEGAGVGLAAATGYLLAQVLKGEPTDVDLAPLLPDRFAEVAA